MTLDELMMFEGIGSAKAIAIAAALELGRRRRYAEALVRPQIRSSKEAFEAIQGYLSDKNFEEFWILLLNRANKVLRALQISEGGVAGTVADPKKIFSLALSNRASGLILCHNHPSGNLQPSEADRSLTRKLVKAGEYIELPVLDHLIIGEENYYSFADEGLL
jgi:DNA repair protein RadC